MPQSHQASKAPQSHQARQASQPPQWQQQLPQHPLKVTCPYCGLENTVKVNKTAGNHVTQCAALLGALGCRETFGVAWSMKAAAYKIRKPEEKTPQRDQQQDLGL